MRLIDADALLETRWVLLNRMTREVALQCFRNIIDEAPTIDAEPVRHGRWVPTTHATHPQIMVGCTGYVCSECGRVEEDNGEPYCRCGAKMDGGSSDGE